MRYYLIFFFTILMYHNVLLADSFSISGRVDVTETFNYDDIIKEFETKKINSTADFKKVFFSVYNNIPKLKLNDVIVTLDNNNQLLKTRVDSRGYFQFTNLPAGEYTVTAMVPNWPGKKTAYLCASNILSTRKGTTPVVFKLNTEGVTLKGRLIDSAGSPIVDKEIIVIGKALKEYHEAPIWKARTNQEGIFIIHGIPGAPWFRVYNYLLNQSAHLGGATVTIKIAGKNQEIVEKQVPMVSEDIVSFAREMIPVYKKLFKQLGENEFPKILQREFPLSQGNSIILGDIVVQ